MFPAISPKTIICPMCLFAVMVRQESRHSYPIGINEKNILRIVCSNHLGNSVQA